MAARMEGMPSAKRAKDSHQVAGVTQVVAADPLAGRDSRMAK